jgi:hypothetical protein
VAVSEPAAGAARDDRHHFLRSRRRVLGAAGLAAGALAVLAALLLAPNRLASLRLGDVGLAWWAAGATALAGLAALSRGFRNPGAPRVPAGTSFFAPLALAMVWSSPAVWLGVPPLLLADGTWGLWAPAAVVGGAMVALLVLGAPWGRTGGLTMTPSAVARARWPAARGAQALLGSVETAVAFVFVWAQLAAAREIGALAGWPRAATVGVSLLVLLALLAKDVSRVRLMALGGGLALTALAVPLAVIAFDTTPAWPLVWREVASRPRIAFSESSAWTVEGGPVRGPGRTPALRFADNQRIEFASKGSVVVEPREGGGFARDVEAGEQVAVHPGDRLVVPGGLRLRFEAGRRVPDAPDSGAEWVEPPARPTRWPWLISLGVTGFLGALGLPTGRTSVGRGRLAPHRSAQLAGALVILGVALTVGWSLYAAWLTPEVYVGGVTGAEIYGFPAGVPGSEGTGLVLTWLALGGLAAGSVAAALGGLRSLPTVRYEPARGWKRGIALVLVASAGSCACLVPLGSWTLLVVALGLAASALAPAAVLACWSERVTPQGAAAGAVASLAVFLVVVSAGPGSGVVWWSGAVAVAPAVVAAPVHLLVAWVMRARRAPSSREPLPPGLEQLSLPFPAPPGGR